MTGQEPGQFAGEARRLCALQAQEQDQDCRPVQSPETSAIMADSRPKTEVTATSRHPDLRRRPPSRASQCQSANFASANRDPFLWAWRLAASVCPCSRAAAAPAANETENKEANTTRKKPCPATPPAVLMLPSASPQCHMHNQSEDLEDIQSPLAWLFTTTNHGVGEFPLSAP